MWFAQQPAPKVRPVYLLCYGDDSYHTARCFSTELEAEEGAAEVLAALLARERSLVTRRNWRAILEEMNASRRLLGEPESYIVITRDQLRI